MPQGVSLGSETLFYCSSSFLLSSPFPVPVTEVILLFLIDCFFYKG